MHAFDILLDCSTGLAESDVRVHHSDAHDRQVLPAHEPSITSTWQARLDGNPKLFNGTKFWSLTLMLTLTLTLAALTLTPSPVQTPLAERRHGRERPCCSGTQTTGAFAAPTFAQPGGSSSVPQLELWPTHWGTLWWWRLQTNRCQRCDADRAVAVIAAQGCRCAAHHVLHAAAILTSAVSTLLSPSPSAPRHASPPAFCPCLLPGDPAAAERRRRRVPGHGGDAGRPPGAVHAAASCCRGHNGAIGVSCGGAIGGGTT